MLQETVYRGCRVGIKVSHDGPHMVIETTVTGSRASPFVRMESKTIAVGITEDLAREVALATGVRWIDAILPLAPSARKA